MHIALKKLLFLQPGKASQESTEQNISPLFLPYFAELSTLTHFSDEKQIFIQILGLLKMFFVLLFQNLLCFLEI